MVAACVVVAAVVAAGTWGYREWRAAGVRADFQLAAEQAWDVTSTLSEAVEDAEWLLKQAAGEVAEPQTLDALAEELRAAELIPALPSWQGWQDWSPDRLERVADELIEAAALRRDAEDAVLRATEQVRDAHDAWLASPQGVEVDEDREPAAVEPAVTLEESSW